MVGSLQDDGEPCPEPLDQMLRPYQMRGFMWMQALDRLHMGGILADDMGLGKTLQVITPAAVGEAPRATRTRHPSSWRRRRWSTTGWRKSRNLRPNCAVRRARARRPSARRPFPV
ncbi:MAG: SNF2-related protein [Christensenellales bacterium]